MILNTMTYEEIYQAIDTDMPDLFVRYRNGDKSAFETICKSYMSVISELGTRYNERYPNVDVRDLVGEGVLALCKSINIFNPNDGVSLLPFAISEIEKGMQDCVDEYTYLIHFPLSIRELKEAVYKTCAKFEIANERKPSAEEIADILDIPVENVVETWEMLAHHQSTDVPFEYNGSYNLIDVVIDEDTPTPIYSLINESLSYDVKCALRTLTPREAEIIRQFFGIGVPEKTLGEIGEMIHLTVARVRQIKEKAIRRLICGSHSPILKTYLGRVPGLYDIDRTSLRVSTSNNIESKEVSVVARQDDRESQKIKRAQAKEEKFRAKIEMAKKALEEEIQTLLNRNLNKIVIPIDKNKRYNYVCRLISETRKIISSLFEWVTLKQNVASLEMIKIDGRDDIFVELDKNYDILAHKSDIDISQKTLDELRTNIDTLKEQCKSN